MHASGVIRRATPKRSLLFSSGKLYAYTDASTRRVSALPIRARYRETFLPSGYPVTNDGNANRFSCYVIREFGPLFASLDTY